LLARGFDVLRRGWGDMIWKFYAIFSCDGNTLEHEKEKKNTFSFKPSRYQVFCS